VIAMPMIEIATEQLKEAFRRLPAKEKIKLVEDLEKETRRSRWQALISRIRKRAAVNSLSQKEINRTCEEVRKMLYEKRAKSSN
jgi:hypothetical protein